MGPARTGVLFYAKDVSALSAFYAAVLDARVLHADADHQVLQSADVQLIVHAIPPHIAQTIAITTPPEVREAQAIKPFFTVASLLESEAVVERMGGRVCGPVWEVQGLRVRNLCDPEGNVIHLREVQASTTETLSSASTRESP